MTLARFFTLALSTLLLIVFTFTACQKDRVDEVAKPQQVTEESNYYTPHLTDFLTDRSGYWTEIPAGSVDVLNDAIAEADAGGVIYLKAGMHTENDRVTVDKPVKIIGEDGAVLMIASSDAVSTLNPALNVIDAPGTAIQNLEIKPLDDFFATAVLFENSAESALLSCKISGFGIAVWVERSDRVAMIGNEISGADFWGVMVDNGESAYIASNDVHDCGLGMWVCDKWGTMENNNFHDNGNGVLLCKWNAFFEQTTPNSSEYTGADFTCTGWKIRNNQFNDNAGVGLAIRDGATLNMVSSNNTYSGNIFYDVLIPADGYDGDDPDGLFIPAALKNTIHATPDVLIKDCGIDNVINGGTLVDTSQDPC